jgi:superfamily II DNA/RNA helicase
MAAKQKREMLRASIESEGEACTNAIIFCNRKVDVDIVAKSLKKHGLNAEPIHGDLDQSHRMRTLDGFRDGTIRFLVASDVAARGPRHPGVSHVFNFDVPSHAEDYVHRIGRTGRAGRKGCDLAVGARGRKYLSAIESLIEQPIPRAEAPWSPEDQHPRADARQTPRPRTTSPPARAGPPRTRARRDTPQHGGDPRSKTWPTPRHRRARARPRIVTTGRTPGRSGGRDRNGIVGHGRSHAWLHRDELRRTPGRTARDVAEDDVTEDVETRRGDRGGARREADVAEDAPKPKRRRSRAKKADAPEADATRLRIRGHERSVGAEADTESPAADADSTNTAA